VRLEPPHARLEFFVVRQLGPQRCMQVYDGRFGLGLQPHRVIALAMIERVEARQVELERLYGGTCGTQIVRHEVELGMLDERIDESDVRHPARGLAIMLLADRLV